VERKIISAYKNSFQSGLIELSDDWHAQSLPPLFSFPSRSPLLDLRQSSPKEYAFLSSFFTDNQWTTFIVHPDRYLNLDLENLPLYVVGDFNGWSEAIGQKQWQLEPVFENDKTVYILNVRSDKIYGDKPVRFKFITHDRQWVDVPADAENAVLMDNKSLNYEINPRRTGHHLFNFSFTEEINTDDQNQILWLGDSYEEVAPIIQGHYYYELESELQLGANVDSDETTFRIFAPQARQVTVTFYRQPDKSDRQTSIMKRVDDRVWETKINSNLHRFYYYYHIVGKNLTPHTHFNSSFKVMDPYAVATVGSTGPAIIWDKDLIKKPHLPYIPPHWHDLVIVEAHVRDLLKKAPLELETKERLGFKGLRKWLQEENNYIKKLGVNAVELQPILEFDNNHPTEYHWGYMPINFFSPESSYASDPLMGSQIEEFQLLIEEFHRQGLAVIIDVVVNHTGEPNHLKYIDKQYYFELDRQGEYTNWSGTGNTLRCNTPMTMKLIIDSLTHLIKVYDVDGFRFDLAEIIGLKALKAVELALKNVKPSIILIAEPWSYRGHIAHGLKHTGFAFWNDGYRDFITDYIGGRGNQKGIIYYLSGSLAYLARWPAQSVNYLESHDDYCWIDRITENPNNDGSEPTMNDIKRTHLMIAVLMCSLGIPMIAAGQDILRSKKGQRNTYQEEDINAIDYQYGERNLSTHEYFRDWINFRLSDKGRIFRLEDRPSQDFFKFYFNEENSSVVTLYNADFSNDAERILFAINPLFQGIEISIEDLNLSRFLQIADDKRFEVDGLLDELINTEGGKIYLPPLSCGLWIESL
jgi:pullulanase/glycogen debranching enzyme